MSQQLQTIYGENKRFTKPFRIIYTSIGGQIEAQLEKNNSHLWRNLPQHKEHFMTIFKGEIHKLVYLSAEATDVCTEVDPNSIYIIGGIVDRNRHKGN